MARSPYREVWHLMVSPDFSRVERGEIPAPYVDHGQVDFARLRQLLFDGLAPGPANIRVPNDTIDQVTIHFREKEGGMGSELMRCKDMADCLRKEAAKQKDEVIDVSRIWKGRQYFVDRSRVPPPIIVPMLVETDDFEDMMLARTSVSMRIGMLKEHPLERVARAFTNPQDGFGPEEQIKEGRLPDLLLKGFEELFGTAYQTEAIIDFVSHDPLPKWMGNV